MALAARHWWLGSGWLLLAIILAHALNPTSSPLTRSSGSAFNGFTAEVSLGPERGAAAKAALHSTTQPNDRAADGASEAALWFALATPVPIRLAGPELAPTPSSLPPTRLGRAPFQPRAPPAS